MKIKLTIIAVIISALAVTLTACNVKVGVKPRNSSDSEVILNKSLTIENIDTIDISIGVANININEIDGDDVTVEFIGESELSENTTVERSGKSIVIKEEKYNTGFSLGNNSFKDRKVNIGIPTKYSKDITLEYGAGNVFVKGLKVNGLDIKGGAGNLDMRNIVFASLDLKQGVGNTDIDLKDKCGNIKIKGGVGNLELSMAQVGGNLTCQGGVGDTEISIPDKAPVKIKTSSGLGESKIYANTSGENTYEFDLNIGVGNLTVN